MERFKASFHKSSKYPPLSRGSREMASQEVPERDLSIIAPQPCGETERDPAAIRVSVIKTNKRNQPEPELEPESLPLYM